jgi:DNA-binding response OmpR family regulator
MHNPPRILIVDDNETNRDILLTRLGTHGYDLVQAADGEEAIEVARKSLPDLILLDVMMPKLDGIAATRRLKADPSLPFMPIILVTAKTDSKDVVAGLDAGADEYLTKPVDQTSLVARVKSMLRVKELHDRVAAQAADLASWNKALEQRVADQLTQIERAGRLKRFLAPQIAELILSDGDERVLDSHRRDVTVVFCDLRGFTAFAETAEPEEVMACCGNITRGSGRSSTSMRARSNAFWATASWCCSTTRCAARIHPCALSRWRSRCATASPSWRPAGASTATSLASAWASPTATQPPAASASRAGSTIRLSAPW